jgi:hypothetical protein
VPLCPCPFCERFRGVARYGKDHADRQTFYGFRLHARLTWPGFISEVALTPANQSEPSVVPHLADTALADTAPAGCVIFGDRNYCSSELKARLVADGQRLLTPPARQAKHDPEAVRGKKWVFSDLRYRIDTVFGQLTDRFGLKSVRTRDLWHLTSRIV